MTTSAPKSSAATIGIAPRYAFAVTSRGRTDSMLSPVSRFLKRSARTSPLAQAGQDGHRDFGQIIDGDEVEIGLLAQKLRGRIDAVTPERPGISNPDH